MRGGCRCFALLNIFASVLVACGGERGTGSASTDSARAASPAVSSAADTTTVSATDTGANAAARGDSTPPLQKPAIEVARPTPVPTPVKKAPPRSQPAAAAPKPAAPAPAPAPTPSPEPPAPVAADTPTSTSPAEGTAASAETQTSAPLRDEYHRAPLDTVTQEVYDGWKQYNLNCARCHGEDVQGTTIAPHLVVSVKPNGPINTKELFVQIVCAGRPEKGMPAWCPLGMEMDKIQAIYAYVKGRSDGKIRLGRPALKPEG